MTDASAAIRRRFAAGGATLFAVGMLTGILSALALTGKIAVGDAHLALAAHLNAVLGGLWSIAAAWTFEFLHYGDRGLRRLAIGISVPAWANWVVTLIASFLGVKGIEFNRDPRNNLIAVLLQAFVVVPSLVACGFWVWGFRRKNGPPEAPR